MCKDVSYFDNSSILLNKSFGYFPIVYLDKIVNVFRNPSSCIRCIEDVVIGCRSQEENYKCFLGNKYQNLVIKFQGCVLQAISTKVSYRS